MRSNSVKPIAQAPLACESRTRVLRPATIAVLLAVLLGLTASPPARASCPSEHTRLDPRIRESSGLIRSRSHPGIYWTHNDSGDRNRIFAIRESGEVVAEFLIDGAKNVDWEDLTIDEHGFLYLGDIGNNGSTRHDLRIYRLPEPDPFGLVRRAKVERTIRFRYPDQRGFPDPGQLSFDAEALFHDRGSLYLLTKHRNDTLTVLYRFPSLEPAAVQVLEIEDRFDVGGANRPYGGMVTAASLSDDGAQLAVLTYHALFLFERPREARGFGRLVKQIDFDQKVTEQCEAISWSKGRLLFTNEAGRIFCIAEPLDPTLKTFPARSEPCAEQLRAQVSRIERGPMERRVVPVLDALAAACSAELGSLGEAAKNARALDRAGRVELLARAAEKALDPTCRAPVAIAPAETIAAKCRPPAKLALAPGVLRDLDAGTYLFALAVFDRIGKSGGESAQRIIDTLILAGALEGEADR